MEVNTRTNHTTLPSRGAAQSVRPSQTSFIRPVQMAVFARVTSYPPLGQVTCLHRAQKPLGSEERDTLRFTVTIESSNSFPAQSWEAQIWHNITGPEWTSLPLQECGPDHAELLSGFEHEYNYYRHVFSEQISLPPAGGHAQFTVRFRTGPDAEWQWANQRQSVSDGQIVYSPRYSGFHDAVSLDPVEKPEEELGKYIDNLSHELHVESRRSEAPGSELWALSGDIDPSKDGVSSIKRLVLGIPSLVIRYFSLVRVWSPWLGPRHGKDKFRLTEDAVLCSFLRKDGVHLVLLAISGVDDVLLVFQSGENGEVLIAAKSDSIESSKLRVVVSAAADFEVAVSAAIYEARKVVRPFANVAHDWEEPEEPSPIGGDMVIVEKDPSVQWLSQWLDGLTYCTWNGLGQDLSERKIMHALDDLKAHGINITNLIIDDGWQNNDKEGESQFTQGWKDFEAHLKGFPRGLKKTVASIRAKHHHVEHVAVWHALLGYWGGISPDGDLARRFKTKQVKIKDPSATGPIAKNLPDGKILAIDPDDVNHFYDEFYSYLTSVGVDSVKTDAQFYLDLLEDPDDRRSFMTSYQDAWSVASLNHFSNRAISCGSMIPQIIFHSHLPTNKPEIPLRNSDDFFPKVPASHTWHVFCNAHNSLLTRYLNVLPDWDMFQTSHPYASFHAAARCVSGGPIYITDEPGKHDLALLDQMTAPTVKGNTVILRPSVVGRSMDIYNDYNEGHVLRVGSYTGWAKTGSGILGLFNIKSEETSSIVSLVDFPGIHVDSQGQYIVRGHTSGKISALMRPSDKTSLLSVVLEPKGWEILTAYPTQPLMLKGDNTHVAVLGLIGKMTGAAAMVTSDISVVENGRLRFDIRLKALGTLGIFFSELHGKSVAGNFMVMIMGRPVPEKTVWMEGGGNANVLAIDVLKAWKAMKLDSGWSNEALVQVFVG
ncbi:hypothetical protein N7535_005705 [Penicillium sp. DV-2018c]|nr:hypothetical protein N7461_009280 [Penicillium sp. DV-2018c]KAJ5572045.1 hypothetical protein N7535_005705 [Penicillium sp. DV-2018c]